TPRRLGVAAVLVGRAGRSARGGAVAAVHAPEVAARVVGVVRHRLVLADVVRLGEGDVRVVAELGDGVLDGQRGRDARDARNAAVAHDAREDPLADGAADPGES